MSSSVDSRIAELKFNNSQFESGIKDSLKSIDNLNKGLKLDGSTKGFQQISEAARGVNLGPIGDGVQAVTNKFSALGVMAITTLANITNRAVDFGINFAKSLTVQPISDGFAEYELKMGSVQTIMSGSGASLDVVNEKLAVLNEYADRTLMPFRVLPTSRPSPAPIPTKLLELCTTSRRLSRRDTSSLLTGSPSSLRTWVPLSSNSSSSTLPSRQEP